MFKYSDVYVSILAKGLLHPGEGYVGACAVNHQPFWSLGIPLFKHSYLLIATTHRLIALDHRKGLVFDRLDRAESFAWGDVAQMKLSGMLTKKVVVKDRAGRTVVQGKVTGFLGPMANNGANARTLVQAWQQQNAQLPATPAYSQLPGYAAT